MQYYLAGLGMVPKKVFASLKTDATNQIKEKTAGNMKFNRICAVITLTCAQIKALVIR